MKTRRRKPCRQMASSPKTKPLPRPPTLNPPAFGSPRSQPPQSSTGQPESTPAQTQQWVDQVHDLPDVRWDKVTAVRDALASGQYDVDARLADFLSRLADDPHNA